MALTTYILPDVVAQVGTIGVTLLCDTAGLSVPTQQTIQMIGEVSEQLDDTPTGLELSTLKVDILDSTEDYDHGFWFKVFNDSTDVRLFMTLDEGSGDTFFFYGTSNPQFVEWNERYTGTVKIRTATVEWTDTAAILFDTPTNDWITEVLTNDVNWAGASVDSTDPNDVVNLAILFASLLKASGLNASYDVTDVSFVNSTDRDIKFEDGSSNVFYVEDIWFPTLMYNNAGPAIKTPYFDSTNDDYLGNIYAKSGELASIILKEFALYLRIRYDLDADRFVIDLIQRGRAYADAANLDFGGTEIESTIRRGNDQYVDAVVVRESPADPGNEQYAWMSRRFTDTKVNKFQPPVGTSLELPNYVSPGIDFQTFTADDVRFNMFGDTAATNPPTTLVPITVGKYWLYDTGAYTTDNAWGRDGLVQYYFARYTVPYRSVKRKYSTMSADDSTTDSHTTIHPLRRISIDDGAGALTYYANRTVKIPAEDATIVEWIQE